MGKMRELQQQILGKLHCVVFIRPSKLWLDTGSPECNAVWGSRKLGLPAGKVYQFAGKKHAAKSAFVAWLCGLAQRQHKAFVVWIDVENSYDRAWWKRLGMLLGSNHLYVVYPKILKRTKQKKKGKKVFAADVPFLQSADMLFKEAEEFIKIFKQENPDRPLCLVIDSIAFLRTENQESASEEMTKNMKTALDRATFLSDELPRWQNYAKNFTMWMFCINQIRVNPTVMFGNPEYSPGGSALEHAQHVAGGLRRKGGFEAKDGHAIRINGVMQNAKNKAGGGSLEGEMCTYQINFDKPYDKGMFKFGKFTKKEK